jgi:hypothetical protein
MSLALLSKSTSATCETGGLTEYLSVYKRLFNIQSRVWCIQINRYETTHFIPSRVWGRLYRATGTKPHISYLPEYGVYKATGTKPHISYLPEYGVYRATGTKPHNSKTKIVKKLLGGCILVKS